MQALKDFFAKYSAVTHIVVAVWVFLAGAYMASATFAAYVNGVAASIAHKAPWLAALFVGAIVPLVKYWKGLSDTGKVAISNEVTAKAKAGVVLNTKVPLASAKVGALALCALLLMSTTTACSSADTQKIVSQINAYIPAAEAIVSDAAAVASVLEPQFSPLIGGSDAAVQLGLQQLSALCTQYLQNPDTTVFAKITHVVDSLVTDGDQALLIASHIKDVASQQKATVIIASLSALLHTLDSLIASTQSTNVVKARMATRTMKLKQVSMLWSDSDKARVSAAFGNKPFPVLLQYATVEGM